MNTQQLGRRSIDALTSCFSFVGSRKFSTIISSDLKDEVEILRKRWDQLRCIYCCVKSAIAIAGMMGHNTAWAAEVQRWLLTVDSLEQIIRDIFTRVQGIFNLVRSFSVKEFQSLYNLVKDLICLAFTNNASEQPLLLAYEMPVSETIGMDFKLKKLMDCINGEENSGIIGLYGMGGSGKTTMMKKLHNNIVSADINIHDFVLVIWIDVSGGYDIDKIMENIRENCKIDDENWEGKSREEKARKIFNDLKGKKYILFVDGAKEEINLQSIGVPLPNKANQSKILITTRFENVCNQMNAKKFKAECLEQNEALDLLCTSAGDETISSEPSLCLTAQELSQECEGLPLALVAVGKAMASRKNQEALMHTLKRLKNSPWEVQGMENVFTNLKSSYDSLLTTIEKDCFLYCALIANGKIILVPDLIRLWIEKGLLGNHDSTQDAFNHGEDVVESLKAASLLEDHGDNSVKMHNMIRNMALWLARDKRSDERQSSSAR